jgi:hypothetical protein
MQDPFNNQRDSKEIVLELLSAFNSFKQRLEDPNYIQMENAIRQIIDGQKDMRQDISELKKQLLNPFDGVIVETKKNTEFREDSEVNRVEYLKIVEEHKGLVRWKATMQKVGVAILTSAGAIIAFLLSEFVIKR